MKEIRQVLLAAAMLAMSSAAAAQISIAPVERGIANVLVKVGTDGGIKNFSVAEKFPPKVERLLEDTLKELVITPSPSSLSKSVGQVVLRFSLRSTPLGDGNYGIQFVAFDSKPVPSGSWYWATYDRRQLTLIDRNAGRESTWYRSGPMEPPMRTPPTYNSHPNTSPPANQASSGKKR